LKKFSPKINGVRIRVGAIAKSALHRHLWIEQLGLCAYCMQTVPENDFKDFSHLEHMKPKGNSLFKHLKFDFENIVMSCNGLNCTSDEKYTARSHCGAYKDNRKGSGMTFNDDIFVNPTEVPVVEECYDYNLEGEIFCSAVGVVFSRDRVNYMIKYLGLDVPYLNDFRRESYESLIDIERTEGVEFIQDLLSNDTSPAVGFQPMMKRMFGLIP
ncbi:retron system putative HNH endonuclease, partial [Neolewinella agarilytica]|uniref:retron system putative HNH endonuclease n=1 Tax=Neolewinella agarilytica TaxID=478744 RepID=UPI0023545D5F